MVLCWVSQRGLVQGLTAGERLSGVLENGTPGVGDTAPDFELPALVAGVRKPLRLSEYRGQKSLVLVFYPFNWQEISAAQLVAYQTQRPRVLSSNAQIVAITVDSIMNTVAWERVIGPFEFPLSSDSGRMGKSRSATVFCASRAEIPAIIPEKVRVPVKGRW